MKINTIDLGEIDYGQSALGTKHDECFYN